ETFTAKTRVKEGTHRISVAFLNPHREGEGKEQKRRELIIRSIEMDGPYNAPPPRVPESHRLIMAHTPGLAPREAAREIITRFASRAFRRPVQAAEVDRSLSLYDQATTEGE